ncbi:homoserine dehydrogenase [Clostridium carnis]
MTKIAVMGYGVVGTGLVEIIDKNRESNNKDIIITSILVKNIEKHKDKKHNNILTVDIEELFSKESDIVIEVIGGLHPAYEYVKRALNYKKHVITANKDLIAEYGEELFKVAEESEVTIKFEAAVGGGIPIIKPLTESLSGNNIMSIKAILNGTTNFILTKMDREKVSYEEALSEAQKLGFAEANPDSDVLGYDAARKLSILSSIAYNEKVYWKEQRIEGITKLDLMDFKYAKMVNSRVKLLAISEKTDDGIYCVVRPSLISENNILSLIDNEVNAIILDGDSVGEASFIGKGAGMLATGSAVFSDLNDLVENRYLKSKLFSGSEAKINKIYNKECSAILRVETNNQHEVIKDFSTKFKYVRILNAEIEGEIGLFIEAKSEADIDEFIESIKEKKHIFKIKKMIKVA